MLYKQITMDLTHLVRGIIKGFMKEIQSLMGHFTSVEGASGRILNGEKRLVKLERSFSIRLSNPLNPLLSLMIYSGFAKSGKVSSPNQ